MSLLNKYLDGMFEFEMAFCINIAWKVKDNLKYYFLVFVSEEGVECVMANKDELFTCVKKSVPEIFSPYHHRRRNHNKMHFYVFQQENCR